jgi:hypothetical protein
MWILRAVIPFGLWFSPIGTANRSTPSSTQPQFHQDPWTLPHPFAAAKTNLFWSIWHVHFFAFSSHNDKFLISCPWFSDTYRIAASLEHWSVREIVKFFAAPFIVALWSFCISNSADYDVDLVSSSKLIAHS